MAFTAQLGTAQSMLGNILLGIGPLPTSLASTPPFTSGPPRPGTPWFRLTPFTITNTIAMPAAPVMTTPGQPFVTGPPMRAPWFRAFTAAPQVAANPPPAKSTQSTPGFTIGPPMPGAPWFKLSPIPPTPPPAPPVPPKPPLKTKDMPLISRDPVPEDQRLRRFTQLVADVVNSLARQGILIQIGPVDYTLVVSGLVTGLTGSFPTDGNFVSQIIVDNGQVTGVGDRAIVPGDLPLSGVAPGTYTLSTFTVDQFGRVTAAASGSLPADLDFIITTFQPLPNAQKGSPYSLQLTTVGGVGAVTYAITWGTLPPGLVLDMTGLLHGTPI
jgi:hypothetical protein